MPDGAMNAIPFLSQCPKCGHFRLQLSHTRGALLSLLNTDGEIVAYCLPCDELWPINDPERRAIVDGLDA
jgi:hypothetical protein